MHPGDVHGKLNEPPFLLSSKFLEILEKACGIAARGVEACGRPVAIVAEAK